MAMLLVRVGEVIDAEAHRLVASVPPIPAIVVERLRVIDVGDLVGGGPRPEPALLVRREACRFRRLSRSRTLGRRQARRGPGGGTSQRPGSRGSGLAPLTLSLSDHGVDEGRQDRGRITASGFAFPSAFPLATLLQDRAKGRLLHQRAEEGEQVVKVPDPSRLEEELRRLQAVLLLAGAFLSNLVEIPADVPRREIQ